MPKRIRIAFSMVGGEGWTGGLTYLSNLFEAIHEYEPEIEIYLITSHDPDPIVIKNNCKVIKSDYDAHQKLVRLLNRIARRGLGYDFLLRRLIDSNSDGEIDAIFQAYHSLGRKIARLYWIPDFQHVHLPEMFSGQEIKERNRYFKLGAKRATLVLLSSEEAHKDFSSFAPGCVHKARVVNFVANVPLQVYEKDPRLIISEYNLPEKFFYLPNQFWKHKNHVIVFEALKILRDKGIKPFIVCTGNPTDYRNPTYLAELLQKVSIWGLRNQIAFLGLLPHQHVHTLIRQSICVLNPSLFEGWSTTVEEAKSVGKRILLSNLPVHQEQDPPSAIFFAPKNAEDLAAKMAPIWADIPPGPDFDLERSARHNLPIRLQKYAKAFVSRVQEARDIAREFRNYNIWKCGLGRII